MKKLAMKMLSLLLVLSLLLPTCVFAQPGQDGDGTPGTQGAAMEDADASTGGGNSDENSDTSTGGGNSDEDADTPTGGGSGDEDADAPTGGGNGDETTKDENGDGNTKDVNGGSVTQSTTSEKTTTFTEGEDGDTPTEEPIVATVSIAVAAEDDGISQEELLEGYLYSISGLYGEGAAVFRAPSKPLPTIAAAAYTEIASKIPQIANGTETSTMFAVTGSWNIKNTDLGLGTGEAIFDGSGSLTSAASSKVQEYIDTDALLHRLLSTKPYELYWFDKTVGMRLSYSYSKVSDGEVKIQGLTFWFAVSDGYHDSATVLTDSSGSAIVNGSGKKYYIATDSGKTSAASTAVTNATNIVNANSSKSDYEKLKAYLAKICELVSYNGAAAGSGYTGGYGDPWQLIYVFDGNDTTNVVCEGYAKAFKYLCDLTWTAPSPAVECYLVTGTMSGGTGAGPHMWNVVHIGVNNYLVDVTNCDTGTIGATDKLFLCGVEENVASKKYTATASGTGMSGDVVYEYDTQTTSDYTAAELKLSGVKYTPPAQETPTVTGTLTAAVTFGDTVDRAAITHTGGTITDSMGVTVTGEFQWDGVTSYGDAGTKTLNAKFVPADSTKYTAVARTVDVTVSAKAITDVAVGTIADQGYTGSQIKPPVTVTGDGGKSLVLNKDYTVDYGANNTVGTNTGSVTVMAKSGGNYTFGNKTVNFNIKAGTSTISITGDPSKTYDGNAVTNPTVDKSGSMGAVTYTYYTDEGCTTETTTASGATSNGKAPKNAGDYWVKATVAADSNYGAATSDAKKFTISQKDIGGATIVFGPQETYDGSAKNVGISKVTVDGKDLISTIEYTIKSGKTATDVGNTTLVIEGTGNYTGEASGTWSLVARDVTITPDAKSKTYGEADPELTFTTSIDGDTTLKGKFIAAKSGVMSRVAGDNVGMYAIKLGTLKAGNNFKLTQDTTPVYLTITPKNVSGLTADISDQTTIKGVGEFVDPVIKGVNGEDLTGTLTYAYDSVSGKTHADVVAMLKTKATNDVVTLNYTFAPPSGNYTGTKTGSFTVTVKDIEFLVGGVTATVGNTLTVKSSPVYGDDWSAS